VKIGVISDTHNYLDPAVERIFAGVEHILHAGDVGSRAILAELERIAPTTLVGGNTDDPGMGYPQTEVIELGGNKFLLHHIVNPHRLSDTLRLRIERERPRMVVFGHTHKPFSMSIDGCAYFNPGYAGKPRFGMNRSVALLTCEETGLTPEFVDL
jgi:putative phosphoesterase